MNTHSDFRPFNRFSYWIDTMAGAPRDGSTVRVRCRGSMRELPWLLYWDAGHWRYFSSGNPVHRWHEPVAWMAAKRTSEETGYFNAELARIRGSNVMPSQDNGRPRLRLHQTSP